MQPVNRFSPRIACSGLVAALLIACASGQRGAIPSQLRIAPFNEGTWVMSAGRQTRTHRIVLSQSGARIAITPTDDDVRSMQGMRSAPDVYDLDLFAGGKFRTWISNGARFGELTIFGSGVPVVSRETGTLKREH